ncbi:MAG: type I methionyl aminopeptidase [Desulfurivibrionaceae bacterium]|nr:type I methionyl aminopeptidase [Desulfobulbales bacterium]MDT8335647.1 type I methionyl aminopeptidase [Desulfurivibrionaceae bacterium]
MGRPINLKSSAEIDKMLEANQIVAGTLAMLEDRIRPGVTTLQLDEWAEDYARQHAAIPAFKGYRGFPGSLCVSLNEEVVHGIPTAAAVLKEGDIVSIDFGVKHKDFYGDAAVTLAVGKISARKRKLIDVTRQALELAIEQARVGNRINDLGRAVQRHVERNGFSVVRQFVGHGIGSQLHEAPEIPNYERNEPSPRLIAGMALAIEPMVNAGSYEVEVMKDGWTVLTRDRKPSAHFEHTVVVTDGAPLVLSRWRG